MIAATSTRATCAGCRQKRRSCRRQPGLSSIRHFLRNDFADRALPDALKLAPCPTSSARLLGVSTNTSGPDLGRQALRPGFLFGFPPICLGGHNPPAGRIRRVIRQSGQRLSRGCQVTSSAACSACAAACRSSAAPRRGIARAPRRPMVFDRSKPCLPSWEGTPKQD